MMTDSARYTRDQRRTIESLACDPLEATIGSHRLDALAMAYGDPELSAPTEGGEPSQRDINRYLGRLIVLLAVEVRMLKRELEARK